MRRGLPRWPRRRRARSRHKLRRSLHGKGPRFGSDVAGNAKRRRGACMGKGASPSPLFLAKRIAVGAAPWARCLCSDAESKEHRAQGALLQKCGWWSANERHAIVVHPGAGRYRIGGLARRARSPARRAARQDGSITAQLKSLGALPADQRKAAGEAINRARDAIGEALAARKTELEDAALDARLATETIDVTLPGRNAVARRSASGHPHAGAHRRHLRPSRLRTADGPEIEDDWHNFEALNFPPHHPARAMHDTFYFGDGRLLRTHTSGVQVRYMKDVVADKSGPPLRMIAAGKVYRSDSDQTHTPMFHQVRGPAGRRARQLRRSQGHARRVRARVLRARFRDALPAELFPVHRTLRGGRHRLAAA